MTQLSPQLNAELAKLRDVVAMESLRDLEKYKELRINGLDDKKGYAAVHQALQVIKKPRIAIEKARKELKADALEYGRAVDRTAKEMQAYIEPIETHLKDEKQRIDDARAAIERQQKIEAEIASVWDEAHAANAQFNEQRAEAERIEKQRQEQEAREAELRRKEEEIARKEREAAIREEEQKKAEQRIKEAEERARVEAEQERKRKEAEEAEKLRLAPEREQVRAYVQALFDVPHPSPTDARLDHLVRKLRGDITNAMNEVNK